MGEPERSSVQGAEDLIDHLHRRGGPGREGVIEIGEIGGAAGIPDPLQEFFDPGPRNPLAHVRQIGIALHEDDRCVNLSRPFLEVGWLSHQVGTIGPDSTTTAPTVGEPGPAAARYVKATLSAARGPYSRSPDCAFADSEPSVNSTVMAVPGAVHSHSEAEPAPTVDVLCSVPEDPSVRETSSYEAPVCS